MSIKDDRLRVARLCRVLTQRSLLGASRFLRLGRCVDLNVRPGRFLGDLSALARGYIHGVTSFSNPGRASRHCFTVSPSDNLTVELVCQGAARGSATEDGPSNVKKVNEDPRGIWSAVDYLTGILIACSGRGYFWSCTPSSILQCRGRSRGALAAGPWAQIP